MWTPTQTLTRIHPHATAKAWHQSPRMRGRSGCCVVFAGGTYFRVLEDMGGGDDGEGALRSEQGHLLAHSSALMHGGHPIISGVRCGTALTLWIWTVGGLSSIYFQLTITVLAKGGTI